jgi:DnaK suppressor protein
MNNEDRAALRQTILEKIVELKKDIDSYKDSVKPVSPDNAIGRITRMEAINSKNMNEATLNKARRTLIALERALAQIDDPDFGYCATCDEPIPFARLMILPESPLCVKCAEALG